MRKEQQEIWNILKQTELIKHFGWLNTLHRFGFTEEEENEICDLIYYEDIDLKIALQNYKQNEEPKVKQSVKDFVAEFAPEMVALVRKNYLEGRVSKAKNELERAMVLYQNSYKNNEPAERRKTLRELIIDRQKNIYAR